MIDLKNWGLTDNRDSKGGKTGEAVTYDPGKYTLPTTADGGTVFRAEVDDATTSGSKYPRKEAREYAAGKKAAWKLKDGCTMSGTLKVTELPTTKEGVPGKLVFAQNHGEDDEFFRLYYNAGVVSFVNDLSKVAVTDKAPSENEFFFPNLPKIALDKEFSWLSEIDVQKMKHTMTVFVDDVGYVRRIDIDPVWLTDTLYGKAGCYLGNNDKQGAKGAGEVVYYLLDIGHEPGKGRGGLMLPPPVPPAPPPVIKRPLADVVADMRKLTDEMLTYA